MNSMLLKLSTWLMTISKRWVVFLTLSIMVLFMIFILPDQANSARIVAGDSISPDTSFFYAPGDLLGAAEEYGAEGRTAYIHARWTFDLFFPLVYIAFLVAGISWFYSNSGISTEWVGYTNLLPIAAGVFDYLENTAASLIMAAYPKLIAGLPLATAIFSGMKWILIGISFLAYFGLAGAALYHFINIRFEK